MRQILDDFQSLCNERVLLLQMHELKQGLEKKVLKSISNIPMQGGCQTVEKKLYMEVHTHCTSLQHTR